MRFKQAVRNDVGLGNAEAVATITARNCYFLDDADAINFPTVRYHPARV